MRSISELRRAIDSGDASSRSIVQQCLGRIDAFNHRGPCLNAIIDVNPDSALLAAERDAERRGSSCGALHGIPIVLKDNIVTCDRLTTTGGSYLFEGMVFERDAHVARVLRDAGAIFIGKSNMAELLVGESISARGGRVRNPYSVDHTVRCSSAGAAVAVAAGFAAGGVGTDASCSIRGPGSDCSLVAIKTSIGLISRAGQLPSNWSMDVVGPVARTTQDVGLLLTVLSGEDPEDFSTLLRQEYPAVADYTLHTDRSDLRGARLGALCFEPLDPGVRDRFVAAARSLESLGATVVQLDAADLGRRFLAVVRARDRGFPAMASLASLQSFFAHVSSSSPICSVEDLRYRSATAVAPTAVPGVFHRLALTLPQGAAETQLDPASLAEVQQRWLAGPRSVIDTMLAEHGLDALVFPTAGRPAPTNSLAPGVQSPAGFPVCLLASASGLPELTVPGGYTVAGLPVGISFLGRAGSESELLGLGHCLEQMVPRREPEIPPSLPRVARPFPLPPRPDNVSIESRRPLAGDHGSVRANNLFADPVTSGRVWFEWTPSVDGDAEVTLDIPGVHASLDYGPCAALQVQPIVRGIPGQPLELASDANHYRFAVCAGTSYALAVHTTRRIDGSAGDFDLAWTVEARPSR